MNKLQLSLTTAPIIEAVVDIDCDMPTQSDVDALDVAARAALADRYPTPRRRMLSEVGVMFMFSPVHRSNAEHLHHLIPQVIDDLHRDPPVLRLVESP